MSDRRPSFYEMGPPDPINYLRGSLAALSVDDIYEQGSSNRGDSDYRRLDSDDEGYNVRESGDEDGGGGEGEGGLANSKVKKRTDSRAETKARHHHHPHQDPPARERPSDGAAWPYRETLSFTRSLVFYGAGSITAESEEACAHIQTCRSMRQKYQGSKGTIIRGGNVLMAKDITFRIGHEVRGSIPRYCLSSLLFFFSCVYSLSFFRPTGCRRDLSLVLAQSKYRGSSFGRTIFQRLQPSR